MKQLVIFGGIVLALVIGYMSFHFLRTEERGDYDDGIAEMDSDNVSDYDTDVDMNNSAQDDVQPEVENQKVDAPKTTVVVDTPTQVAPVVDPAPDQTQTPEPTTVTKPSGITMADVRMHATKSSCYTVVGGSVYDITSYIPRHPGGEAQILRICGKDGSALFQGQHGGEGKPEQTLAQFRIGALVQ